MFKELLELMNYNIVEGSEYCWPCYPDARFLDLERDGIYVTLVHRGKFLYEAQLYLKNDENEYVYRNMFYEELYHQERKQRRVEATKEVQVSSREFLDKLKLALGEYSEEIILGPITKNPELVTLELDSLEILTLALKAHEADMTINQYISKRLEEEIARLRPKKKRA